MSEDQLFVTEKALSINQDPRRYGTFAEIGAGQEVVRHFFQAGLASNTIAKTMSAYDMQFSDAIYGADQRYVSEARLNKMLDHEYALLTERLGQRKDPLFFVFADTVTTSSSSYHRFCHGWMGVRFQQESGGDYNDVVIHVKMRDPNRLQQQEAIGVLGVNLIFTAFYLNKSESQFVAALVEGLGLERVEIDSIQVKGPDFSHMKNTNLNMELLQQGISRGVLFSANGEITQVSEALYEEPLVIQRGTFRPITQFHIDVIEECVERFKKNYLGLKEPFPLMEIFIGESDREFEDYLNRVEVINALGYSVLVSNLKLPFELAEYLRSATRSQVSVVTGLSHLSHMFNESYYEGIQGGLLSALGRLFDGHTQLFLFPNSIDEKKKPFEPEEKQTLVYQYLLKNKMIELIDIDKKATAAYPKNVEEMFDAKDMAWKSAVPEDVVKLIQNKNLFGHRK